MPRIEVATTIEAPPEAVWARIEDVATHVDWMADAEAIRFTSDQTAGVGTTFDCDTKVGPLKLTDRMAVTEWEPDRAMGVRHEGLVTGEGRFTLTAVGETRTDFAWAETLHFPWWMGGPVGGAAGAPVLRAVWRRNLARLKDLVEQT
jgi:carbon monoxide dehydrogenase subunit G